MDYIKEIRSLVGHRPILLVGAGAIIGPKAMIYDDVKEGEEKC